MESIAHLDDAKFAKDQKRPTVLVAGGAGFLGSFLCEALVSQNLNVICLDSFKNGAKENIKNLLQLPNFTLWEEDISKSGFVVPPSIHLSHIFHLASVEEFLASDSLSLQTLVVNSIGTKNLLDLAVEKKARFVLVSSTEVFHGALAQTDITKYFSQEKNFSQLTFAEAKRFSETLVAEYAKSFGLKVTIVRVKDLYGPRMNLGAGAPLPTILKQTVEKKSIKIIGDGLQTINPTFVTDIIFGLVKASFQGISGDIFNLVNPEKYTERDVAEAVQKITEVQVEFKEGDYSPLPNTPTLYSKAEEKLGWAAKVGLDDGLKQTLEFFEKDGGRGKTAQSTPKVALPPLKKAASGFSLPKSPWRLTLAATLLLVVWAVGYPAGGLFLSWQSGQRNLDEVSAKFAAGDFESTKLTSEKATGDFKRAQESAANSLFLTNLVGVERQLRGVQNYLFMSENVASAAHFVTEASEIINRAANLESEDPKSLKTLREAKSKLDQAAGGVSIALSLKTEKDRLPALLQADFERNLETAKALQDLIFRLNEDL